MKKESLLKVFFFHSIIALIICPFTVKALSYVNLTPGAAFDYFSDLQEPYHTGSNMPEPYYRINTYNDTYYAQFLQKSDTYISEKSGFTYGNISLCNGEPVLLVNSFFINTENKDFYKNARVYLSQDNKLNLCSTTYDVSTGNLQYKCNANYLKNSTFEIFMEDLDYSLFANYNVENRIYTYKSFQVTCNPSTSTVIDNQNQNKEDIINNNNQNKNEIMNSIGAATGTIIGNQNQNNKDLMDNQDKNFDDLNQNIKDQFNECHMEGGKNLFHTNNLTGGSNLKWSNFSWSFKDSHIILNSSSAHSGYSIFRDLNTGITLEAGTYTVSIKEFSNNLSSKDFRGTYLNIGKLGSSTTILHSTLSSINGKTFTLTEPITLLIGMSYQGTADVPYDLDIGLQIEKGSNATSFEEYSEEHEVCSNKMDQTNEKLDGINDSLTNDDVDTDGAGSFFNGFNDTDHGGISGVVTAPIKFINKLTGTCNSLSIKVFDKDIELPCGDTLFWNKTEVSNFRIIWNMLLGGPILYLLVCKLFKVIENLKNPDDSRVEVMKL